ncbi:ferredoxin [Nocardia sp. NPDC056611]|uniref:ferredoxin n=1 Tax=Nocardia sp. NPDC056611 TaxID=3345877 RepID=UPI00366FB1FD
MKIIVEPSKCDGLGMCEAVAPDLFEVGPDGIVRVLDDAPGEDRRVDVQAAIDACPVLALKLSS